MSFQKILTFGAIAVALFYGCRGAFHTGEGRPDPLAAMAERRTAPDATRSPRQAAPAAATPCDPEPAIYRPTFTDGVAGRLPQNQLLGYGPSRSQMTFYAEVIGAAGQQVTHTWFSGANEIAKQSFSIESERWPTWSTQAIGGLNDDSLRVEVSAASCPIGVASIPASGEQLAESESASGWMHPQNAIEVLLGKPRIDYASADSGKPFVDDLTESGDTLLVDAIRRGDTAEALMLIEKQTDVGSPPQELNAKEAQGWFARRTRKADPFLRGRDGASPIQLAHDMGNEAVVEALIDSAITPYRLSRRNAEYGTFDDGTLRAMLVNKNGFMRFEDGDTPLLRAVRRNNERAVLTLLQLPGWKEQARRYDPPVDPYAFDANGKQALTIAREQGNHAIERFLLLAMTRKEPSWVVSRSTVTTEMKGDEPADCRQSAFVDETRLHYFTELTDMDGKRIVHEWRHDRKPVHREQFRVDGRRWSTYSSRDFSPADTGMWEIAVLSESGEQLRLDRVHYQELTDYTRENRAKMNSPCNMGGSAFIELFKAHAPVSELEYLVDKGMALTPKNSVGELVLERAIIDRNLRLLGWLLDNGFDVNGYAKAGKTPLMMAAEDDSGALALFLKTRGADLEFKEYRDGRTALHVAAIYRNSEIAEALLRQGAHIDAQSKKGSTALHVAVGRCDLPTTLILLGHGADPTLENKKGEMPGDFLMKCEERESWDSNHPALATLETRPVG